MSERCEHGRSFPEYCETCREEVRAFKRKQHRPGLSSPEVDPFDIIAEQTEELVECQGLPWNEYWTFRNGRHWRTRAIMAEDRLIRQPAMQAVVEAARQSPLLSSCVKCGGQGWVAVSGFAYAPDCPVEIQDRAQCSDCFATGLAVPEMAPIRDALDALDRREQP